MFLGKRPRQPIKRTTSMTGITVDLGGGEAPEPLDQLTVPQNPPPLHHHHAGAQSQKNNNNNNNTSSFLGHNNNINNNYQESYSNHNFLQSMLSPRTKNTSHRQNSADFIETADFLRTCGLCKRRLAPGRDIYIYMGDMAFCSLECREKHIKQAEKKGNSTAGISSDGRSRKTASSVAAT